MSGLLFGFFIAGVLGDNTDGFGRTRLALGDSLMALGEGDWEIAE